MIQLHQPPKDSKEVSQNITKLNKAYDPALFRCLSWNATGVTFSICCSDSSLKGFFTSHKPSTDFNYGKFKKHCIENGIHYKRIIKYQSEILQLHPMTAVKSMNTSAVSPNNVESSVPLLSDLDRIINALSLVHLNIKLGLPLSKIKPINEFCDSTFISHNLSSDWYISEIINAMDCHQKQIDRRIDCAELGALCGK